MAFDPTKIEKDYKALQSEIRKFRLAEVDKLWQAVRSIDKAAEVHEKTLRKAAHVALSGADAASRIKDLPKDRDYAAARKVLDKDHDDLGKAMWELTVKSKEAAKVRDKVKGMQREVEREAKALEAAIRKMARKSAEQVAATKTSQALEKLAAAMLEDENDLDKAADMHLLPTPYMRQFHEKYDKIIKALLEEAVKKAETKTDDAAAPEGLSDKALTAQLQEFKKLRETVDDLLDDAAEAAREPTPDAASVADLRKKAATELSRMKRTTTRLTTLMQKSKAEVAALKTRAIILKKYHLILAEFEQAEKAYKTAMK